MIFFSLRNRESDVLEASYHIKQFLNEMIRKVIGPEVVNRELSIAVTESRSVGGYS